MIPSHKVRGLTKSFGPLDLVNSQYYHYNTHYCQYFEIFLLKRCPFNKTIISRKIDSALPNIYQGKFAEE